MSKPARSSSIEESAVLKTTESCVDHVDSLMGRRDDGGASETDSRPQDSGPLRHKLLMPGREGLNGPDRGDRQAGKSSCVCSKFLSASYFGRTARRLQGVRFR